MTDTNKDTLRKPLIAQRLALTKDQQQQKSANIIKHIEASAVFQNAEHIAFYHAVRGEADPHVLYDNHHSKKKFYLPLLLSDKSQGLIFAPIDENTHYKKNVFSIPEPIIETDKFIPAPALDLVIMPLLGFDQAGNRLGMGGGYYDRCFAFKKDKKTNPTLIGFAYSFQEIEKIKKEPWDISLEMIATEESIIRPLHERYDG